ncbi:RICIN domain-containing protein [Streptomyces sp. NBC_00091]|uniref:RICIN domain-containing protein n=1 Tax=Streptomyces sp. NBC_00091 TaxID=2975648 RepID=UPI00224CF33A|nr:RICIN domain-containing protein [Streptomyces sp. NBC_00091]MCX5380390.1 RICIN domain-containing protein [Streptomyces sp. NBC_00091]
MHIARKSPYRLLLALLATVGFTLLVPASPASASATASAQFFMKNQNSGMCMDVPGGTDVWGTQLIQWPCNGKANQNFYSGCNGGENQRWYMTSTGNGVLDHFHNWISKKCMEVADWRTDGGAPIRLWECHTGKSQQFWNF